MLTHVAYMLIEVRWRIAGLCSPALPMKRPRSDAAPLPLISLNYHIRFPYSMSASATVLT